MVFICWKSCVLQAVNNHVLACAKTHGFSSITNCVFCSQQTTLCYLLLKHMVVGYGRWVSLWPAAAAGWSINWPDRARQDRMTICAVTSRPDRRGRRLGRHAMHGPVGRDENGTDIFRPYSKPNPFRGVEICPYSSPDIQHPIPYPYPNTQSVYLWCRYPIVSYPT